MPAIHDGSAVLANARLLARVWRVRWAYRWGTEQNPSRLGANDADLRALVTARWQNALQRRRRRLGEWLRPPAKPQQGGNARRACPSTCKSQRNRPQSAARL